MTTSVTVVEDMVLELDPAVIRPQEGQPRIWFDEAELQSLADAIQADGQIEAGSVRPVADALPIQYEIVDGERRWRCCIILGRKYRAVVKKPFAREIDQFKESCISNFHKSVHHCLEIARAVNRLRVEGNFSDAEIGKSLGKSHTWVYQHRSLLKLCEEVRALMMPDVSSDKQLRYTHALELVDLSPERQLLMANRVINEGMSLAELKLRVRQDTGHISNKRPPDATDDYRTLVSFLKSLNISAEGILDMNEERFKRMLSTKSLDERMKIHALAKRGVESLGIIMQEIERRCLVGQANSRR